MQILPVQILLMLLCDYAVR